MSRYKTRLPKYAISLEDFAAQTGLSLSRVKKMSASHPLLFQEQIEMLLNDEGDPIAWAEEPVTVKRGYLWETLEAILGALQDLASAEELLHPLTDISYPLFKAIPDEAEEEQP
jgi:hypothetical protein